MIIGYLVYEPERNVFHFLFVKAAFRKLGVAKRLLHGIDFKKAVFTHWTKDMDWITKRYQDLRYNPYASQLEAKWSKAIRFSK